MHRFIFFLSSFCYTSSKVFMHYFIEKEKEIVTKNNPKLASKLFEGFHRFHPIEGGKKEEEEEEENSKDILIFGN